MSAKLKGLLSKPLQEKKYQQILKKIYVTKDRELFQASFKKGENGVYTPKADLTEETVKSLNKIGDAVKKNAGFGVNAGNLILAGVVIGGVLVFSVVFKNPLFAQAIRLGLQSVFHAKADVSGVSVSLLQGRVKISHLAVADEMSPMKNLVELGLVEFNLSTDALLRGKVVIESMRCEEIRWNTDRKTWGGLSASKKKKANSGEKKAESQSGKPLLALPDFSKINAGEIFSNAMSELKSPAVYSNANVTMVETTNRWAARLASAKKSYDDAAKQAETLKKINVSAIKTLQDAQNAYNQINSALPAFQRLKTEADQMSGDFSRDSAAAKKIADEASAALSADQKRLFSSVQVPGGVGKIAGSLANVYLSEKLGAFYTYALQAKKYAFALKGSSAQEKKAPEPQPVRRGGSKVYFPTRDYPAFLLKLMSVSLGEKSSPNFTSVRLSEVTSDPYYTKAPMMLAFTNRTDGVGLEVGAGLDIRTNAAETVSVDFSYGQFSFAFTNGLDTVGIKKLSAAADVATTFALSPAGVCSGVLKVNLSGLALDREETTDLVKTAIAETLLSEPKISLSATYRISSNETLIEIDSSLDEAISRRVGKLVNDLVARAEKELQTLLDRSVGPELSKYAELTRAYQSIEGLVSGRSRDAASYTQMVDQKKKEIENRIAVLKKQGEDQLRDEAKKRLNGGNIRVPGL